MIVDDGSSDNTKQVIEKIGDSRIRYHYQVNAGVCAARNKGAQLAKGKYLAFVDSDDWVSETWLWDFAAAFEEGNCDVVVCKRTLTSDSNKTANSFLAGSFAISKEIFAAVHGYDEKIRFGENTELKWRLTEAGARFRNIDNVNLVYDNTSNGGSVNRENKLNSFLYLRQKHQNLFNSNKVLAQTYYQVAGVDAFRIGKKKVAWQLLWQGYSKYPQNIKAFARVVLYGFKILFDTRKKASAA